MGPALQFATSAALVIMPAVAGWRDRGRWVDAARLARRIQAANMIAVTPLVMTLAMWILPLDQRLPRMAAIALGLSLAQLLAGLGWARLRGADRRRAGSLALSATLSNTGVTLGGFLCFVFIGEAAFGLTMIYNLAIVLYTFTVCFPFARIMGERAAGGRWAILRATVLDPRVVGPLAGVGIGVALSTWGGERPRALSELQAVLVPVSTAFVMYAVGLGLDTARIGAYVGDCVGMSVLKFVLSPLAALGLLALVDPGPEAAKVVLVLAVMPSAINSCVIASLFALDVDAATACFLGTTAVFVVAVLPFVAIALRGA